MARYSNANHAEFHKLASGICVKHTSEIDDQPLIDDYSAAVSQESDIFIYVRRSEFTKKKEIADRLRDESFMGVTGTVRVNLTHFDADKQKAAVHLDNLLSGYNYLPKMNYDAETAAVDSLVAHMRSAEYAPSVGALQLAGWVDKLDEINTQFKTYVQDTAQEEINRPSVTTKQARIRSDNALGLITTRVEALVTLNGKTAFTGFIAEYNTLAKHYNTLMNEHIGRIHARTDISNAVIALITQHPFTGKPIIVIPDVAVQEVAPDNTVKTKELVFTQDFTVSYANNVKPGTATLSIRGIGKYKGEVVTTFNIVNN
jgi:hypothetical protein